MNIIRKIKLEQLGYYKYKDNKEKELFDFIKNNLLNLTEVILESYSTSKFYFKNDKLIFEMDSNLIILWVNYNLVWKILKNNFEYKEVEVHNLILNITTDIFKNNIIHIDTMELAFCRNIEYEYKMGLEYCQKIEYEYNKKI